MSENSEVLERLNSNIEKLLNNKRLRKTDRMQLETMQLFVIFLREDHRKVQEMYPAFTIGKWAVGILAAANLVYLFNLIVK